jgi:hypothetical protein
MFDAPPKDVEMPCIRTQEFDWQPLDVKQVSEIYSALINIQSLTAYQCMDLLCTLEASRLYGSAQKFASMFFSELMTRMPFSEEYPLLPHDIERHIEISWIFNSVASVTSWASLSAICKTITELQKKPAGQIARIAEWLSKMLTFIHNCIGRVLHEGRGMSDSLVKRFEHDRSHNVAMILHRQSKTLFSLMTSFAENLAQSTVVVFEEDEQIQGFSDKICFFSMSLLEIDTVVCTKGMRPRNTLDESTLPDSPPSYYIPAHSSHDDDVDNYDEIHTEYASPYFQPPQAPAAVTPPQNRFKQYHFQYPTRSAPPPPTINDVTKHISDKEASAASPSTQELMDAAVAAVQAASAAEEASAEEEASADASSTARADELIPLV